MAGIRRIGASRSRTADHRFILPYRPARANAAGTRRAGRAGRWSVAGARRTGHGDRIEPGPARVTAAVGREAQKQITMFEPDSARPSRGSGAGPERTRSAAKPADRPGERRRRAGSAKTTN